jgi:hypothetical protein
VVFLRPSRKIGGQYHISLYHSTLYILSYRRRRQTINKRSIIPFTLSYHKWSQSLRVFKQDFVRISCIPHCDDRHGCSTYTSIYNAHHGTSNVCSIITRARIGTSAITKLEFGSVPSTQQDISKVVASTLESDCFRSDCLPAYPIHEK